MDLSINRIRLEFKVTAHKIDSRLQRVLIESDWNLKFDKYVFKEVRLLVLIESDWNLKDYFKALAAELKKY